MIRYSPMAMGITTSRLVLRPWDLTDVADYQALVTERGKGVPTVEDARARIRSLLAGTAETGIALLVVSRVVEKDFLGYCGLIVRRTSGRA
jgi:hypothetical protein